MPGKNLVLDGFTFTNPSLKYLRDDVVLPKQGALMLIDPTHPALSWASGVPADASYIPNVALSQARALYGATDSDAQAKVYKPSAFSGAAGLLERTGKGGLHGISPKAGGAVAGVGAGLVFSTKLIKYILDNPKHDYYMSAWYRVTREPLSGFNNSQLITLNCSGQQTNSYLFNVAASSATVTPYLASSRPVTTPPRLGYREDGTTALTGNKFISMGTDQWWTNLTGFNDALPGDGTATATTGSQAGGGIAFGSYGNWLGIGSTGVEGSGTFNPGANSANKDKNASYAFYRFYLEDLTVSGRTYAQVDALSWAEYTKQVLTAGGRYYNDTFTDPATLP